MNSNENPLGYEKIPALIRKFAIPSIIAMLVGSIYNIVDQIFIGQGVGYLGNAATNVAFPVTTIAIAIFLSIGVGAATRFSIYLGEGNSDKAARVCGIATVSSIIFGFGYAAFILLFIRKILYAFGATDQIYQYALTYTKITTLGLPFVIIQQCTGKMIISDGSPKYSMATMVTGAVLNTILDPIFIFIFHWGIAGAAWATVISQVVSFIMTVAYYPRFKRIDLKKEHFVLSLKETLVTMKFGMSQGLTQTALAAVMISMNRSMVYYGQFTIYGSEIPLAASGIVMKVNSIVISVLIGISQGLQPIAGFNYGARKFDRVKKSYLYSVMMAVSISAVAVFVFELWPGKVLSIFGSEDKMYMEFAEMFMRRFLVLLPFGAVQMISSNFFSAIGKSMRGAFLSVTRQVLFFIPLLLILPLFMGFDGILVTGPSADAIACILSLAMIIRFFTKEMKKES